MSVLKNQYSDQYCGLACFGRSCLALLCMLLLGGCSKDKPAYQNVELAPHDVAGGYRVEFLGEADDALKKLEFHKGFIGTLCRAPRQESTEGLTSAWVYEFKALKSDAHAPPGRSGYAVLFRTGLFRIAEWNVHENPLDARGLRTLERDVMNRYGCKNDWTP